MVKNVTFHDDRDMQIRASEVFINSYSISCNLKVRSRDTYIIIQGRDLNEHTLYAQYFYKSDESSMNYIEQ